MPEIDKIQDAIRMRVVELDELLAPLLLEAQRLREMDAALRHDNGRAGPQRGSAAAGRPRPGRGSAPRRGRTASASTGAPRGPAPGGNSRRQQALARITAQPGITAAELAEAMGIARNYLYRVLPRLEREGAVTKQGTGYHAAADSGS